MKKRLSVLVLALAMILTMSASVFADSTKPAAGDNAKGPDAAYLVKYLKKAEGVNNPNASFTFTLEAQDQQVITVKDSNPAKTSTTAAKTDYPDNGANITTSAIAASSMASANIEGTSDTTGKIKIADIFSGKTFKRAGEYVYKVTENDTFTNDTDPKTKETMNDDSQAYYLHLYVKNVGTGNDTAIDKVSVEKEDGTKVDPSDVDPTPGTGENDPKRTDPNYKADGFTFTNEYIVETENPATGDDPQPVVPTDPTSYAGFGVSKAVSGDYADRTQDFTFKVKITAPAGYTKTTGKYVVSAMTNDTDASTITAGTPQDFTYGTEFEVSMHHGENFGVTEMALGSKVEITEQPAKYYTPEVSGLITVAKATTDEIACGSNVVVGSANKGHVAAFVNTMEDDDAPTPTGIIINNLPYVLLIGLALGGIVLFSRKRRYE